MTTTLTMDTQDNPVTTGVGKGYFSTSDVFYWEGDFDDMGNEVNYDNLREDYGDVVHDILNTEECGEYVQPHDEFPYETRTFEEWVIEEFGPMSQTKPILIKTWARRYATLTSDDNWETYYSDDYGSGDWGGDETLLYKGQILSQDTRDKLADRIVFPHPYVGECDS